MIPALTLAGFKARSIMPAADVDIVEAGQAGFTAQTLLGVQSKTFARLRKRYNVASWEAGALLVGPPSASGTSPPAITFSGTPTSGDLLFQVRISTAGPVGSAQFQWSKDGGVTWSGAVATSPAPVVLPGTGVSVNFPAGAYSTDNLYQAATPIPEVVLRWITDIGTPMVYRKRGINPSDPTYGDLKDAATRAEEEITEAANSKDGLFDLPLSDDNAPSNVTQGGPLGYSETSPYAWTDIEANVGSNEDAFGRGTTQ